ncbi:acylphosphatase [Desulfovibrio oxamicus]|uniref:Acylphosphatase n=1 Tax=Nitratidesulfovibrio oxamicus TaxID=32016 RepID=A0ABS0J293_9BACT|nr:acylphosphatase [Nitratidesulfovibrio oxamicus]MBG3876516.1 acylphosphatase [Nitratidesulfovibrio oxamicus]
MTRSRFRVTGRVQGVGFRSWTGRTARALGLAGWVRNLPDGSVELEAQGPVERMDALREALWKGPVFARVTGVEEQALNGYSQNRHPANGQPSDASGTRYGQDAPLQDFHIRF